MTESMGYVAKLAMQPYANLAATTTFSSSSKRLDLLSHDLRRTIDIIPDEGLRGTRTRNVERLAMGQIHVGGSFELEPTVAELEALMPFILGTASSGGTYAVADSLPYLYLMADCVAKVYTLTTKVTSATFTASPGGVLRLRVNVVGTTLSIGNSGTFDSASIPVLDLATRYRMSDLGSGITINSVAYSVDEFQLTIDNHISPTYMQGQTATDLEPTDRTVMLQFRSKYTSTETTLETDQVAGTARAGSLAFTNAGSEVFSFTFGNLVAPPQSVVVPGRDKLRFQHAYQAYGVSTTKDVVVALPA